MDFSARGRVGARDVSTSKCNQNVMRNQFELWEPACSSGGWIIAFLMISNFPDFRGFFLIIVRIQVIIIRIRDFSKPNFPNSDNYCPKKKPMGWSTAWCEDWTPYPPALGHKSATTKNTEYFFSRLRKPKYDVVFLLQTLVPDCDNYTHARSWLYMYQ